MDAQTDPPEIEVVVVTEPHTTERVPESVISNESVQEPTELNVEPVERQQTSVHEAELAAHLQSETTILAPVDEKVLEPEQKKLDEVVEPRTVMPERSPKEYLDLWEAPKGGADEEVLAVNLIPTHVKNEVAVSVEYQHDNVEMLELPPVVVSADEMLDAEVSMPASIEAPFEAEWEEVLYKPSTELHEDFVRILELHSEQLWQGKNMIAATPPEVAIEGEVQPVPPIVTTIVERLVELDEEEKEASAQALREVVGALHGLQTLASRDADQETVASMEQQLTELCKQWLESLDIEYTEQDVKTIVLILRGSELTAETTAKNVVDIKDLGTHEEKYFAQMAAATVSGVEHTIQAVLGTLVLSAVGLHGQASKAS